MAVQLILVQFVLVRIQVGQLQADESLPFYLHLTVVVDRLTNKYL